MQRLHEDDLVGHVLGQEPWDVVCFPAIAEDDEVHQIKSIWGTQPYTRKQGEALHPAREPLSPSTISAIRSANTILLASTSSLPPRSAAVWSKLTGSATTKDLPEKFDRIVQSWDTANKASELSDYSVCTTWGILGKNLYLMGLLRRRLEYPALKRAVLEQQNLYGANVVLIEDKASGTQLIQELIVDGCHAVTRYEPHATRSCGCMLRPR